jgi:hypothetical protein
MVDHSPKEMFDAANNVPGWWSQNIEGRTVKLGSEFNYNYEDVHRCTIKIVEFEANKKVVWLVEDNYFSFIEDETEWNGTIISFDIAKKGKQTETRFTHAGLNPDIECFDGCSDAWISYIKGALRDLIAGRLARTAGKYRKAIRERATRLRGLRTQCDQRNLGCTLYPRAHTRARYDYCTNTVY